MSRLARLVRLAPYLALVLTVLSLVVLPRLRLSGDLARLFPDDPQARALGAYVRAFGGGDVTTILVRGDAPEEVERATEEIAAGARGRPGIRRAVTSLAPPPLDPDAPPPDPTLAWLFADDAGRAALREALSDAGMKARLEDTRALLMAPGSGALAELIRHDPLRLLSVVQSRARTVAATVGADASGALVADGGRARFVLVTTDGSALRSEEARRVVEALEAAIGEALPRHPGVRAGIAGGAAIARDAEKMIRRDLYVSSAVSTVLVSLAFLLTFRRARALIAIAPPLLVGTLWTTAIAAAFPDGIAAIAMGFASVVIGVGLDTGVHVYSAVLRAGEALAGTPFETPRARRAAIVDRARAHVARPTLTAAIAAGFAFSSLALSRLPALRQLGLLCAAGEVLTAIAILALTPAIAAWLESERGAKSAKSASKTPPVPHVPHVQRPSALAAPLARLVASPHALGTVMGLVGAGVIALVLFGPPRAASALVAVKPRGLPSLQAQEEAIELVSGGRAASANADHGANAGAPDVQLVVLQRGRPEARDALLARGESLAGALRTPGRSVESIADWLPSPAAVRTRLAERDAALVGRADALSRALVEEGFAIDAFEPALGHLRAPAGEDVAARTLAGLETGVIQPLLARHLARDPTSGDLLLATYVRAPGLDPAALAAQAAKGDPDAVVTGYPVLERSLRAALVADLPRVSLVSLLLVAIALRSVLRGFGEVLVALTALAVELLIVALVVRAFGIPVHVYDALVLPVLVGITVDESMFLLHAMREGNAATALGTEARSVVTTALTTAAGFAALLGCGFPGLRDLGAVGLTGTLAGLVASLVVVPVLAARLPRNRGQA
jgi:hypothetical protein